MELKRKILLMISQLKKRVYDELSEEPPEHEPFQGPLGNFLRVNFHAAP